MSRSVAVVIAYLIYTHNMSHGSAFKLVPRKRACIKPNSGFVCALQDAEYIKRVLRPRVSATERSRGERRAACY